MNIVYICDECNIQLDEGAETCFDHPDATITSLARELTVKMVKELLPDVLVSIEGNTYLAGVYGRTLDFARVQVRSKPYIIQEVSWDTVTRAFNNNTPIIF
jgi:hypothetical protein